MKPMSIILVGAFIAIIGGIVSAIGTWKHNKGSSEKSTRIEEGVTKGLTIGETTNSQVIKLNQRNEDLINQSLILNKKIENQSHTIDNLRKENADLYSKLSEKSLAIYENLTGGDSYCRMQIGSINIPNDIGYLYFFVEGKNPLNRVQARIVDLNTFNEQPMTFGNLNKNIIELGTLDPDKVLATETTIKLNKTKGVNLNVFFSAGNGFTNQQIRMRFAKGKWQVATQITNVTGTKELYKKIDPDYPIAANEKLF